MQALLLQPNQVPHVWNEVAPLITKAVAHAEEDVDADDFLRPIINGQVFLWIVTDESGLVSVCFGSFDEYPRQKSFHIYGWATKSGRQFDEVMDTFNDSVVNFAKINGCDFIEAKVRKGLAKKLKWNDNHSLVTLTLNNNGRKSQNNSPHGETRESI